MISNGWMNVNTVQLHLSGLIETASYTDMLKSRIFGFFLRRSQWQFEVRLLIFAVRSTVVKVLCYKSEGRWFDPSWCQWIFH